MQLIIFGISEIAKCAYEYFQHDSDYEVVAFTADSEFINQEHFLGLPIIPFEKINKQFTPTKYAAFAAIGAQQLNRIRTKKYLELKNMGYTIASYISSKAFVWRNVEIGEHSFILENNTLQPFVKIGNNVTLWSGNHIGHGTTINDNCFITSHVVVSGCCSIGRNCFIGVNSSIADCVTVENDNFIGMHAKIDKSTLPNQLLAPTSIKPSTVSAKKFCRVQEIIDNA